MYVKVGLSTAAAAANTDYRGLLKSVELEIGGQRIDKQYYKWQVCWQDLTYGQSQVNAMAAMAGLATTPAANTFVYLPLDFWFCRNPDVLFLLLLFNITKLR